MGRNLSSVAVSCLIFLAACSGDAATPTVTTATSANATAATDLGDQGPVDSDESLVAALTGQILADEAFRVGGAAASCVAMGMVELLGGARLAEVGVTADAPAGPDGDPFARLTGDELGDVVAIWSTCADVALLVTEALLASSPEEVSGEVRICIQTSLSAGMGARFLLAALSEAEGAVPAVTDVLRVLDGCTIGAERLDLAPYAPGLWPWLAVDLPGFEIELASDSEDGTVDEFLNSLKAVEGVDVAAVQVRETETDTVVTALIVAAVQPQSSGIAVDDYVAGLVSSADGAEVFEFPLPNGVEVIGWEDELADVVFLVWPGERVVVFATGGFASIEVLALYSELVPGV